MNCRRESEPKSSHFPYQFPTLDDGTPRYHWLVRYSSKTLTSFPTSPSISRSPSFLSSLIACMEGGVFSFFSFCGTPKLGCLFPPFDGVQSESRLGSMASTTTAKQQQHKKESNRNSVHPPVFVHHSSTVKRSRHLESKWTSVTIVEPVKKVNIKFQKKKLHIQIHPVYTVDIKRRGEDRTERGQSWFDDTLMANRVHFRQALFLW